MGTKKLDKKLRDANKRSVPFVIVLGADEVQSGAYTIKNMQTGETNTGSVAELCKLLT
jgi:histidyl-tRNA synthetase